MLSKSDFLEKKVVAIFTNEKERISFSNCNLVVKDENNQIKKQFTCYRIFCVFIIGGFSITSTLLEKAKEFNFSIYILNSNLKPITMISNELEGNTFLREKQYSLINDVDIARKIIENKIKNQARYVKKLRKDYKEIEEKIIKLKNADNINEIMGVEGVAAKIYFTTIFDGINWQKREPRLKRDLTNLFLDIGYNMLFNYIDCMLNLYGFDTYKGVLHQEFYKRKSLVCDMIEPFRPIIDNKVRNMYNLKQIDSKDFNYKNDIYSIKIGKSQKYTTEFLKLIINNQDKIYDYIKEYYYWLIKDLPIEKFPEVIL